MKGSAIGGILGGVTLGVAAVTAFNMMSRANQRKVRSFATRSGRVLSSKVNELFGK